MPHDNHAGMLRKGQHVSAEPDGTIFTVEAMLGGGSQGEVYRIANTSRTTNLALKWYFPNMATQAQWNALVNMIQRGRPNEAFLWPLFLVKAKGGGGFGYAMPLKPVNFATIPDLLSRRIEPSFACLAMVCANLAYVFRMLHAQGLYYCDISPNNIFFDPKTGEVLIADNDNVRIDGDGKRSVDGTLPFMAPELIRGETTPNSITDQHSLATLNFHMLFLHHPFEGSREANIHCFDEPAMRHLYGEVPVFIFDPQNETNRPVPGRHDNAIIYWSLYPSFLRHAFVRTFTEGLRDPLHARVREIEWCAVFNSLLAAITHCSSCHNENFYSRDSINLKTRCIGICWSCGSPISIPARIRIGERIVVLEHGTMLYPHYLGETGSPGFGTPVAKVMSHPLRTNILGLRNESTHTWLVRHATKGSFVVRPGQSVELSQDLFIDFGTATGNVRLGA